MQSSCTINQDQRSRLYRRSRKNFPLRRSFSTFFVTAGILLQSDGPFYSERILYGWGIKDQPNPLSMRDPSKSQCICLHLRKTDPDVSLVTVGSREFYVYRYEGELNGIPNAAVILSYPKDGFGNPKALRVFLSTNAELSTQEILDTYTKRWPIELFFRQSKSKLALDSYQIRSRQESKGIG